MPRRIRLKPRRQPHFIRQWREHRGLTQQSLAERLHMSAAQLSRIENGHQPYTQDLLEACAEALRTDPASLLMRNPSDPEAIWSVWERAKPAQRRQLMDAARTLLKVGTAG
jgi:transcriptional regulator with XRE-family HTH domain